MDYKNGKIHPIRNHTDDDVYVGSTTQSLSKRFSKHISEINTKNKSHYNLYQCMRELGKDAFYISYLKSILVKIKTN